MHWRLPLTVGNGSIRAILQQNLHNVFCKLKQKEQQYLVVYMNQRGYNEKLQFQNELSLKCLPRLQQ
jgi:hypothetical protein